MNLKTTLVLIICFAACSFQTQASLCNGGFEDGFTCWHPFEEAFGFAEITSSYTDASGHTFTPTEGSSFLNIWGGNDLSQHLPWSVGDSLSFDWVAVPGRIQDASGIGLFIYAFNSPIDLSPIAIFSSADNTTTWNSTSFSFTDDGNPTFGTLLFATWPGDDIRPYPFSDATDADVAHMLIDNVQLIPASSNIPEPNTVYLIMIAMFLGWTNHKTRRHHSI